MFHLTKFGVAGLAAVAALPLAPAGAQTQAAAEATTRSAITVMAPRARETGRSTIGAPIQTLTAQSVVYFDDLNLRTEAGRDELENRVSTAAAEACDWLDEVFPPQPPISDGDCRSDAVKRAQAQVEAAISQAG